jgi:hypothetical protein
MGEPLPAEGPRETVLACDATHELTAFVLMNGFNRSNG